MFALDEDRARELLREHELARGGEDGLDEALANITIETFNEDCWHRAVSDVLQVVFDGEIDGVDCSPGALLGADGYEIVSYPLDWADTCDVLITLRRRPMSAGPFAQVADLATEVRKIYDIETPGVDGLIELCRNVVHLANRLKPYLDKLAGP